mgnify:CR=1 FL=1
MTKTFGRRGDCQSVVFATGGVEECKTVVLVCTYFMEAPLRNLLLGDRGSECTLRNSTVGSG